MVFLAAYGAAVVWPQPTAYYRLPGKIGAYTTSGTVVNPSLISVSNPTSIAVSGSNLFVENGATGVISEYTTSGALVNASLVTGVFGPGIAVSGSELFVTNYGHGTVGEYALGDIPGTVTSSNPALISGLDFPCGIAVSGSDLFVTSGDYSSRSPATGEYRTSGATVNAALIPGWDQYGVAVVGTAVPEPATIGILGLGATVLMGRRRRRIHA